MAAAMRRGKPQIKCRRTAGTTQFANALVQNIGGGNTMLFNRAAGDSDAEPRGIERWGSVPPDELLAMLQQKYQ